MKLDPNFSRELTRRSLMRQAAGGLLLLGSGAALCAVTPTEPAPAPAPDFTLRSLNGANLRLREQRGRVVMLNFWATWCGPCREEMPQLNKLYAKYRASGFVLLGVNVDDDAHHASDAASKMGLAFPVLLDTDKTVSRLYDVSTMPSTMLIDRDGRLRHLHRGYHAGYEDEYDRQIRELLR
jgi:peroxiredoxin